MRCRRVDVGIQEICSSGGVLLVYGVDEAQRFGVLEMRCSRRDIEVWSSGALEECCRRVDVDGALAYCLLLLEFLAFVPRDKTLAVCVTCRVSAGGPLF